MIEWTDVHLGLIYQIYGLAFVVLGVCALLLPRHPIAIRRLTLHLQFLGLFGLFHGALEFVEWEMLRNPQIDWLHWVGAALLPTSYVFLLEFGRRSLIELRPQLRSFSASLYALVGVGLLVSLLWATEPRSALAAWARLFIGAPASLLAAAACWLAARQPANDSWTAMLRLPLRLGALGAILYAVLTPVVSLAATGALAWLPTQADFVQWVGLPVPIFRAGCALLIMAALVMLVRRAGWSATENLLRVLGTVSGYVFRCRDDSRRGVVYLAGGVERLTGYTAEDFMRGGGLTLDDLIHPEDKEFVRQQVRAALAQRREYEITYRTINRAGEEGWAFERGRGVFDENGALRFIEGHVVDATALRQAQADLEHVRTTLDLTLDAVFIFDAQSLQFTYVNQGAIQQVGWCREELLRLHPYDLTPEYPEPRFRELIAPMVAGEVTTQRLQTWHKTKSGQLVPVELSLQYVVPTGQAPRFVAIVQDITERRAAENALKLANERLERAERHTAMGHWEFDAETGEGYWSKGMFCLLGFPPGERPPALADYLARIHADDRALVEQAFVAMEEGKQPQPTVFRTAPELGPIRYLAPTYRCIRDEYGKPKRYMGTLQDVSERERALETLRRSEQEHRMLREVAQREQGRMAALLGGMSIGILFEDRAGDVEYVNPAFRRMWGIDEQVELVGRPTKEVLEHSTHRFARPDHASRHVLRVLDTHEISERFELDLYDGRVLTQLSYPVMDTEGRLIGRLWIYEDITHERQTAQQLVYLAEHDPLTGLCNRHRFQEHLERMIKTAQRVESRFVLMYFDLDDFKHINDNFGHRAGDTVLVRAAGAVASLMRGGEVLARLGGDEFAILAEITSEEEAVRLAERIVHAVSSIPLRFRGSNLRLTASLGIAIFPTHGTDAEELVAHADMAMYQAKDQGKNTWAIYDHNRAGADVMLERMSWSRRIAAALSGDLFELHFQGVYHAADGRLSHLEALVRMQDPSSPGALLMPGQFIPVAEKTGQILEIDRWVLRQSIGILARYPQLPALAVNISGRSFDEPGLPQYIQNLLASHSVDPKRLIVELTETAAVSEMQDAQRFIELLQQTGCVVCLDDFGSGFATFAYLKYLAVQVLKIDGMFIRDLPNNRDNQAFVKAMIDVAAGLQKRVVAEFVEDAATLEMLRNLGVDLVQGYYLDRPSANHPSLGVPSIPADQLH